MDIEGRVGVLLALFVGVVYGVSDSSHCTKYTEYNALADLTKHDDCMSIQSVFKLLVELGLKENAAECRNQVVHLLSNHFGDHAQTPDSCQCQGVIQLQQYHTGSGDGVTDHRQSCLNHNPPYRDMYHQFFESHRRNSHVTACMTHHTVWSRLKDISHSGHFCQKDIIFHLNYAFEHHPDNCTCKEDTHRTQSHSSHGDHDCHHYDSFNKLWQLGETDGCLSANSVWHYLDDIQVKDPVCRQKIQHHLAGKYKHATSQDDDNCICNERRQLVNHQIHKMSNGSLIPCLNANGTYPVIEADLFSNISASGCQNHNYLWTKLEGVHNHCKWTINHHCSKETDCTEDIIVRAAIQYPTDESDSCICTKASSSTVFTTSSSKHPTPVVPSSSEAPMPTLTAPSTTSANQHVTVSSAKVTQSSTAMPTPQTSPTIISNTQWTGFACNKVAVVEKIAKSLIATHPNSSACKSNVTGGSDDAYVLATCNVMSPITWGKGANVMADCESSIQSVPTYTPISTFYGDIYNPLVDQPGIFLGCYNNGIKIAIQKCNGVPEIVHIENGTFASNPKNYYLIV